MIDALHFFFWYFVGFYHFRSHLLSVDDEQVRGFTKGAIDPYRDGMKESILFSCMRKGIMLNHVYLCSEESCDLWIEKIPRVIIHDLKDIWTKFPDLCYEPNMSEYIDTIEKK